MAEILVRQDNALELQLSADERDTFNFLDQGQLANYITIWLADRFKTTWRDRINRLTTDQKRELRTLLATTSEPPTPDVIP